MQRETMYSPWQEMGATRASPFHSLPPSKRQGESLVSLSSSNNLVQGVQGSKICPENAGADLVAHNKVFDGEARAPIHVLYFEPPWV